jgi:hypothetical protein
MNARSCSQVSCYGSCWATISKADGVTVQRIVRSLFESSSKGEEILLGMGACCCNEEQLQGV